MGTPLLFHTMSYSSMKNAELKDLLKERDLPTSGKKAELVARLEEHDAAVAAATAGETSSPPPPAASGSGGSDETETTSAPPPSSSAEDVVAGEVALATGEVDPMSLEARKARAERFGSKVIYSKEEKALIRLRELEEIEAKRKARAERFGLDYKPLPETLKARKNKPTLGPKPVLDPAAARARAERFGTALPPALAAKEEAEKIRKRQERFGMSGSSEDAPSLKKSKGL